MKNRPSRPPIEVSRQELFATATYFGYTFEQFMDLRPLVRQIMVVDRRKQLLAKAAVASIKPPPRDYRFTIRVLVIGILIMAALIGFAVFAR